MSLQVEIMFILGQKKSQTQQFTEEGKRIPVTTITMSPCYLVDVKTKEKNGYFSVKLGVASIKNPKKPQSGELKKAGIEAPLRFLREVRLEKYSGITPIEDEGKRGVQIGEAKIMVGQEVKPEVVFKKGDRVMVSGTSKGKGFQGVVKRHGFAGGPRTHGQSDRERAPGSIGSTTTPGRVFKGKRMAGRMGGARITVQNLEVVSAGSGELTIKGLVPGARETLLEVKTQI